MEDIAQVRFADELVLFGEYNDQTRYRHATTLGRFCTRLHVNLMDAYEHWRWHSNETKCVCGLDKDVELATNCGEGFSVPGRACRRCMAITYAPRLDRGVSGGTMRFGLPPWWLKS